jgi:hypothetical protein
MNSQPLLIGAALAMLCAASVAQDQPPASDAANQSAQAQPTPKMSGQKHKSATKHHKSTSTAKKTSHSSHHSRSTAAAGSSTGNEMISQDEQAYRNALRQCAREQEAATRDSCLDNAIEHYGRNG